jgi:predicted phage terminase large subunit-like protein
MASSLSVLGKARAIRRLREELRQQRASRPLRSTDLPGIGDVPLYDLIPRLSPGEGFEAPLHLGPLVEELEAAIAPHKGQRFFWFSVPPGHYKTTTLRAALTKHLARWPQHTVGYFSNTQALANRQSRIIRRSGEQLGWTFSRDSNRQDEWSLTSGGGLMARGIENVQAGLRFRFVVIDDPIAGREVANSAIDRERIFNAIEDDALPRLLPDGCAILVHTRWHPDDPIGRYAKRDEWRGSNIPALGGAEENEPLLPDVWTFPVLDAIRRANIYKFDALYQGRPRSKGTKRFDEPAKFDWAEWCQRPPRGYRVAYGVDLAYTAKTSADFSVCLKLLEHEGKFYVVDVIRRQVQAPEFTLALKSAHSQEPGPMLWIASSTELGAAQFIKQKVPLKTKPASTDKFLRSERVAEAWNQGKVLVPGGDERPAWVDDFLDEVTNFTGVRDAHDDQVDSLVAAFDVLAGPKAGTGGIVRVKSKWS